MFTEPQSAALRAALDRIIPPDDFAGAWEAGVGDYLTLQFERDLRDKLPIYRQGLDALNIEATTRYGSPFNLLEAPAQDSILRAIEADDVQTTWPVHPGQFFRMMINHAAEGYYADPANGGNRNEISWKMIGFKNR